VWTECNDCYREVQFQELLYKRNLKKPIFPVVSEADEVKRLIDDPGGKNWYDEALRRRLEERLQDSYELYMDIICEMNKTAENLREELNLDKTVVQKKLTSQLKAGSQQTPSGPPLNKPSKLPTTTSLKSKWEFKKHRLKFSFNEVVRKELFEQLADGNKRLKQLLETSDTISALEKISLDRTEQTFALEEMFKTTWKKSGLLFKAIQKTWQCSCHSTMSPTSGSSTVHFPKFVLKLFSCLIPQEPCQVLCGRGSNCSVDK
jgi:hypothetical protein